MHEPYDHIADKPALLVKSHAFSLVWIIPLAAALAALWLGWRSYAQRGADITILFSSAAGIEAGKTRIKYKDTDLGIVSDVGLSDDLTHIVIKARMEQVAAASLTQDAKFWIVNPSIAPPHFTGIGTFISGPYIEFMPGKDHAAPARHFIGQEPPSIAAPDGPGTVYKLHATRIRGIDQGTPVYFNGATVGKILGYELSDVDGSMTIYAFVQAPHDALVRQRTRFWNISGIELHAGSDGLNLRMESLQTMVTGGIAFDVPQGIAAGGKAQADTDFTLYADEAGAQASLYALHIPFRLYLPQPASGLAPGAMVRLQGVDIGRVTAMDAVYDAAYKRVLLPVTIEIEPERIAQLQPGGAVRSAKEAYAMFDALIAAGLRARLGTGSLLTGQKIIDLAMLPGAPPARLRKNGIYPEIPTIRANDMDTLMDSAQALLATLRAASAHVDEALAGGDNGSDLAGTLQEVKDAARAVRVLSDDLDNHPEALLRGKTGE